MAVRIPDDWINSVVPIESISDSTFLGTGFLMNFYTMPLLITNKHVIDGKEIQYRVNMQDDRVDSIKIGKEEGVELHFNWVDHPESNVDLTACIVPFIEGAKLIGMYFDEIRFDDDIYDGRDLFFWGFPTKKGAESGKPHYPLMRQGMVAQNRDPNHFLMDGFVFPGSSGSPVYTKPLVIKEGNDLNFTIHFKAPRIVGIISHFVHYNYFADIPDVENNVFMSQNTGLSEVIKAQCIFDIINSPKFKEQSKIFFETYELHKNDDKRSHAYDFDPSRSLNTST
jgi:hypothetical protein